MLADDRSGARPHLELTREHLAQDLWQVVDGDASRTHAGVLQWAGF